MTRQERHQAKIDRVTAYKAWLRAGCPSGPDVPPLPSRADFRAWHEAQQEVTA